jgi:hypothetical protein
MLSKTGADDTVANKFASSAGSKIIPMLRRERSKFIHFNKDPSTAARILGPSWRRRRSVASAQANPRITLLSPLCTTANDPLEVSCWVDSVEKVPNLKSLQICQNANGIFD